MNQHSSNKWHHTEGLQHIDDELAQSAVMMADPREQDPEYVWRQKEKQWLSELSSREYNDKDGWKQDRPPKRVVFIIKTIVSAVLFVAVWGVFQTQHPQGMQVQNWIRTSMSESFPFEKVAVWYEQNFGSSPSFLPVFPAKGEEEIHKVNVSTTTSFIRPTTGEIVIPYSAKHPAIEWRTERDAAIVAMDTGRVIFAGERTESDRTIIIQHSNGYQTTYGKLQALLLEVGDWVKAGEQIGKAQSDGQSGVFYFAIMLKQSYLDPADVIPFD